MRRLGDPAQPGPYNLLFTRRWMLLVPRRHEKSAGLGVNGMGFAGSLLVRNAEQMAYLRRRSPLLFLRDVVG
jgi:ATP adenylyltransferase